MNNVIIFSVFQKDCSEDLNYINTVKVEDMLKRVNIDFKAVQGMYKGTKKESFAIDLKHKNAAIELCYKYNQESYLVVDKDFRAKLVYLPLTPYTKDSLTRTEDLGYFREVSEDFAKKQDGYSYDEETGKYFTCIKDERKTDRISFNTKTWRINE